MATKADDVVAAINRLGELLVPKLEEIQSRVGESARADALAELRQQVRYDARNALAADRLAAELAERQKDEAENVPLTNGYNALRALHWLWHQLRTARFYIALALAAGGFLLAESRAYMGRLATKAEVTTAIKIETERNIAATKPLVDLLQEHTDKLTKDAADRAEMREQLQRLLLIEGAIAQRLKVRVPPKGTKP